MSSMTTVARLPRFKITPKACGFQSGVDVLRLNQLNDELEMEELQRKLSRVAPGPVSQHSRHCLL